MIGKLLRRLVLTAAALPALMLTSELPALASPPEPVDPMPSIFQRVPPARASPSASSSLKATCTQRHSLTGTAIR